MGGAAGNDNGGGGVKMGLDLTGRFLNRMVSFAVFCFLDVLDMFLCLVYKLLDYMMEAEWKPCYCSSAKDMITRSGNILVSEDGGSKIVRLSSTKLHLEEISDTLYWRPSVFSEVSESTVKELRRIKSERMTSTKKWVLSSSSSSSSSSSRKTSGGGAAFRSTSTPSTTTTFTINSTIVEMLQGKIGGQQSHPVPRWSECNCKTCTSWSSSPSKESALFVHTEGPKDRASTDDVLFIHGFISSSLFWTETVFPNLTEATKSKYRLFAVDLLGFGRSPKPTDSLYTLREHLDMIEKSVLEPYKVKSFHIVAHSLGSILALALAVKFPGSVKSLTLIAPPYFPAPKGEKGTQYVLRKVAPRRVWPPIAFGASVACWYEHISRTVCLVMCKNHRLWDSVAKLILGNRMRTFLLDGFFCHTHNAAWHTLHNIICGSAAKMDGYLDTVRDQMDCDVTIFHGSDDELLPVACSQAVGSRIPRARVKIVDDKDHITIVVGRQKAFARDLEGIWNRTTARPKGK